MLPERLKRKSTMRKLISGAMVAVCFTVSFAAWPAGTGYRHIERVRVTPQGALLITLELPHDQAAVCGPATEREILVESTASYRSALLMTAILAKSGGELFHAWLAPDCGELEGRRIAVGRSAAWK